MTLRNMFSKFLSYIVSTEMITIKVSNAVAHVAATGSFPIILGGDHSIGYPTVRGIASVTSKRIGIIHVDRHADIQEKDLDERMHTTPYFHATNLPNVRPENLVQIGIGG